MNILLLQGPLGPFFNAVADALKNKGHNAFRIHFNAGDRFYGGHGQCHDYDQSLTEWSDFLSDYIHSHAIDMIVLYGGCRPYHKIARDLARSSGIQCKVLEEGYLRPDWVTCENFGVNGDSTFLNQIDYTQEQRRLSSNEKQDKTGNTFGQRFLFASLYFHAMWWQRRSFPNYTSHHINPSPWVQGACWLRNFYRKFAYKKADRITVNKVFSDFDTRFFILPLQVATDSQIIAHSSFDSINDLILHVMRSFADHAPKDCALLIKHHPIDRGHSHYGEMIKQAAKQLDIEDRIIYGHDWHLPDLLRHTQGIVTLNSTVGISGLIHYLPVKVLGQAFWDLEQITAQQSLATFWQSPAQPNKKRIDQLIGSIRFHTQLKGSFYKHIDQLAEDLVRHLVQSNNRMEQVDDSTCFKSNAA